MSVSPPTPHSSDSNKKDEYSEFELLAEHHINVQKISLANGEKLNGPLRHESTASIGHSQWYDLKFKTLKRDKYNLCLYIREQGQKYACCIF